MFEATEVILEPGGYRAKLKNIVQAERKNFDTGEPEACRDWTFEVIEEGFEGTELRGRTSMSFGPRSKAREWVQGVIGRKVETGEKLGLTDLVGKECDLSIVHNDTDRGTFANISSVNPVRKGSRKATTDDASKIRDALGGKRPDPEPENDDDLESIPF